MADNAIKQLAFIYRELALTLDVFRSCATVDTSPATAAFCLVMREFHGLVTNLANNPDQLDAHAGSIVPEEMLRLVEEHRRTLPADGVGMTPATAKVVEAFTEMMRKEGRKAWEASGGAAGLPG
jgi:hypothetical protein